MTYDMHSANKVANGSKIVKAGPHLVKFHYQSQVLLEICYVVENIDTKHKRIHKVRIIHLRQSNDTISTKFKINFTLRTRLYSIQQL